MSLNATLNKRIFIGLSNEYKTIQGKINISINEKPVKVNLKKLVYMEERIGEWYNAYHIHRWFIDNCKDRENISNHCYPTKNQLKDLLDTCKQVKEDKSLAETLLPGSIDPFYFMEIIYTIRILEDLFEEIKENPNQPWDFIYFSSR